MLLDQRDVHLCAALNAGYLLRLSLGPVLSGLDDSIVNDIFISKTMSIARTI